MENIKTIANIKRLIINFFVLIFILLIIFVLLLLFIYYFIPNNYLIIPYDKTKYFLMKDSIVKLDEHSIIEIPIQYEMYYKFDIESSKIDLIISTKLKSQNICLDSKDLSKLIKFKPNTTVFIHNKTENPIKIQIKTFTLY